MCLNEFRILDKICFRFTPGSKNSKVLKKYPMVAKVCDSIPKLQDIRTEDFNSAMKITIVPFFLDDDVLKKFLTARADCFYTDLKIFNDDQDFTRRSKYVMFACETGAVECLLYIKGVALNDSFQLNLDPNSVGGSAYYCKQYQSQFLQSQQTLKSEITEWLEKFSREEEKEKEKIRKGVKKVREGMNREVEYDEDGFEKVGNGNADNDDDEGWTVVSRHGKRKAKNRGTAFTQRNQARAQKAVRDVFKSRLTC